MIQPIKPSEFMRHDAVSDSSALLLKRLETLTLSDSSLNIIKQLPAVKLPSLQHFSISGLHPKNDTVILAALELWAFPSLEALRETVGRTKSVSTPPESKYHTPELCGMNVNGIYSMILGREYRQFLSVIFQSLLVRTKKLSFRPSLRRNRKKKGPMRRSLRIVCTSTCHQPHSRSWNCS